MNRSPLKRNKPLNRKPWRPKRGRIKSRPKGRTDAVSEFLLLHPRCELCPELSQFEAYNRTAYYGPRVIDPHHVCGRSSDDERNLVAACRKCHDFVQSTNSGRILCWYVLHEAGRFDREFVREIFGRDPIGAVDAWLSEASRLEPWADDYGKFLLELMG